LGGEAAFGAITYSALTSYRTGEDPYLQDPEFGWSDAAYGSTSTALEYTGAGPLGGVFQFSGAARADATQLGIDAQYSLRDYPLRSYVMVVTPGFDYLPVAGFAQASATDQVVLQGAAAEYSVRFDYRLKGSVARGEGNYDSFFRPVLASAVVFSRDGVNSGSGGISFYPTPGLVDIPVSMTVTNVPANVPLSLTQFLQTQVYAADSMDESDIDPFVTENWDPTHITYSTALVGEEPYTVSAAANFLHTLELVNVAILDATGAPAVDALLASENGVQYPGQGVVVPEPTTLLAACATAALVGTQTRRRARRVAAARFR
jgi:hypothetical protein